ncbi:MULTISPECIES: hypothetical protein [unclassified Sphingomonas]|uniref:hypothetical protein n=1 Tax=unclassified Sphingomonas TaxID=196159 RepID=UPI00226A2B4A|nr:MULTISPECIES: hypothetical protein [unclassified Sphingomonas]
MAKISALDLLTVTDGTESIPVVSGGRAKRMLLSALAKAVIPFLVAWYKGDKGEPGGNIMAIGSKLQAAGQTINAGTTLVRVSDFDGRGIGEAPYTSAAGADATTLAKYPRSTFQSADGRYFARVKGSPLITEFGARPDGSPQSAIFAEAIDWATNRGVNELIIPTTGSDPGFFLDQTLNIENAVTLRGTGTGRAGADQSKCVINVADGIDGIVTHRSNTGPRAGQPGILGADGSRILGLKLVGGRTPGTVGLRMRARAEFGQNVVNFFGGSVSVAVGTGSGGSTEGNANAWSVHNSRLDSANGHGLDVDYADANAGSARDIDVSGCNGFGVRGNSFLSCIYGNIQMSDCGTYQYRSNGTFAGVNYIIGNSYYFFVPAPYATSADLGAHAPSLTDPTYWLLVYKGANGAYPVWQQGATNYAPGGPFMFAGPPLATGIYTESNQGPGIIQGGSMLIMGTQGAGVIGNGCFLTTDYTGALIAKRGFVARDPTNPGRYAAFGDNVTAGKWAEYGDPTVFPSELAWAMQDASEMGLAHGSNQYLMIHGQNHTRPNRLRLINPLISGLPRAPDNAGAVSLGLQAGDWYVNITSHALTEVQ